MKLALTIIAIISIFIIPIIMVKLTKLNKILGAIGAIVLCYAFGFAMSTIGLSGVSYDKGLTETIAYVLVALSIPLILFSIDLRSVKTLAKSMLIGYTLCIISAIVVAVSMFFICKNFFPEVYKLCAMTIGLYTGGTPNLNAIGASMQAGTEIISAANLSDSLVGGIYFLLLVSLIPKLYSLILKKENSNNNVNSQIKNLEQTDDYAFGFTIKEKNKIFKLIGAFFLAVGCLGVGALIEFLVEGTVGSNLLYILLSVSILGVAFSFIKPVREIKGQYTLGSYLILMFSLALSMSIDWSVFLSDILPTLLFFLCAQIGVILIQIILCKIFKIDGKTAIITSTAGVYGPPFIAPVAKASRAENLIAPGVICGALGLAIGTMLGLGVGSLLYLVKF